MAWYVRNAQRPVKAAIVIPAPAAIKEDWQEKRRELGKLEKTRELTSEEDTI
jgi:hypothetical protein